MSVVATSVSGLSSILKSPRIRNRNTEQRVRFRLPENLRTILLDFTNRKNIKYYEELIYTIRDGDVQDDDLVQLLTEVQECISLVDRKLSHFVEALLMVDWVHRNSMVVKKFQGFLLDLLSAHNYYTKSTLEKLIPVFKSVGCEVEWTNGVPTEEDVLVFGHAHAVLRVLLQVMPINVPRCGKFPRSVSPCHHGMAHPWVADGDGLQMWRIATNILKKQLKTSDKGWSSRLGVGQGASNFSP